MILTRQGLPCLEDTAGANTKRGGYVLESASDSDPQLILLASGSEVAPTCEAASSLRAKGIRSRVVNLPCWELFESQSEEYRRSVLLPEVGARMAVEAGSPLGWERYVGMSGAVHGIDRFGASAPIKALTEKFGYTPGAIAAKAETLLG